MHKVPLAAEPPAVASRRLARSGRGAGLGILLHQWKSDAKKRLYDGLLDILLGAS